MKKQESPGFSRGEHVNDWTKYSVVRDKVGDLWVNVADDLWSGYGDFPGDELEIRFGPLTPVLDADGLPVVRTVGDLTALDALPVGSVVMEGSSGAPLPGPFGIPVMPGVFHRFPDGWHVVSGHGVGTPEFDLGPLTVLHTPCEVLDD